MSRTENREPGRVRAMFDGIAGRYDLLNHLLSGNQDRRWRRRAAREVPAEEASRVLDLCGGTGDLTLELARVDNGRSVICCDFSHKMLELAAAKFVDHGTADRCFVLEADGLRLPFASSSLDAVTVAFGVRNFHDLETGFGEIRRTLRPGGRMVVLEFSRPTAPVIKQAYAFYLKRILPHVGDGVSGRSGPYGYLARTIADFPEPAQLAGRIRESGFAACGWITMSGGIVAIHTAFKAQA